MTKAEVLQILVYLFIAFILSIPLGRYIACVYEKKPCGLDFLLSPFERFIHRCCDIHPEEEMDWIRYLFALLSFNFLGLFAIYLIIRLQAYLPLNPQSFAGVPSDLAFNVAVSFVTNTNWQSYAGENTLSYFTQMAGLTVQNFLSAATGLALLMAFLRGLARRETKKLGNFWSDLVRGVLYILLPLSLLWAILLASQGVIQNLKPYQTIHVLQPSQVIAQQIIPMGPVASQVAIKQLGTNGGGFFNTNAAHPFENPTPFSNFLEMLAILLIPASLCHTFGILVNDKRQGWAVFIAMASILIPLLFATVIAEQQENPYLTSLSIQGGNLEGKEVRIGIVNSALWATLTTATSNGSVNAMLDSFTPLGGLIPLSMMHLGEVIFGGIGSGLCGMLMFILMTVFIAGLMVGRTPEYLGKKIEPYEIKMVSLTILIMPLVVLISSAFAMMTTQGLSALSNPGPHGLSEILYAFTSLGNNNGSAFAGLNTNTAFYNTLGGLVMLMGRYWTMIPLLAIAGSLAQKKKIPQNLGTLSTHTPLFIIFLIIIITLVSALSFLPVIALGPLLEYFTWGHTA